jgi:hypothetical protein
MRRFRPAHPKAVDAFARSRRFTWRRMNNIQELRSTVREPFALRSYSDLRCHMTQAQHYYFQADQAKRLARQVADSEVREKLLEMAGEYRRYAEFMEASERPLELALD